MADTSLSISAAVGIRNGLAIMPNFPGDLTTITTLFDRIPSAQGGTSDVGGTWPTDRNLLIAAVAAQIVAFQTTNSRPVIDGVVDRDGGSLRLMNQLAVNPTPDPGSFTVTVVDPPEGYPEDQLSGYFVAEPNSLPGKRQLQKTVVRADYMRKLVRVDGSSIKWFGVVIPRANGAFYGSKPHINFTPTPIQGHYYDSNYESFSGWGRLWADYTSIIGGQVSGSTADQILIIPFYRTSQQRNLGDFLDNWKAIVSAVATAAISSVDPLKLRDTFTFDSIVSSSFSNGWVAHQEFFSKGAGVADATDVLFDLDGVAGGSHWQPAQGVIYQNRVAPGSNPSGNIWCVGGRWDQFASIYGGNLNTHACCRNHLLYHGLWMSCT